MNRLILLSIVVAVASGGCASQSVNRGTTRAERTETNEAVARRMFTEILNAGRYEVANEIYAPDFRNGKYTVEDDMEAARGGRQAVPDMRFDIELVIANEGYVAVLWRGHGTNTGTGNGLPGTGRTLDTRGVTIWKVTDGKLKEEWTVMNEASVRRQLGLGCEPAMF